MDDFTAACVGIEQLHARFVDATFRQDAEQFANCFAKDGVWQIAGMELVSRSTILERIGPMLGYCERIQLLAQTPMIDLTDDGAQGRQQMVELSKLKDGSGAMTIGVYHDRYVHEDGAWRYARRHWTLKYRGPLAMSGLSPATPDYGAFPAGPAADEATYVLKK